MREHCASQHSSPRCTPSHRRRAASDPARDIARLAAMLRIAASRIARLQHTLQQQPRPFPSGQCNGGQHPPQPQPQDSRSPPPPPSNGAAESPPNTRQRRSARRAAQWWQNKHNSSSLEKNLSSPNSSVLNEAVRRASPAFDGSILDADSAAEVASSRQQTVSEVREVSAPAAALQQQQPQQGATQPPQPAPLPAVPAAPAAAPSPPAVTVVATAAARRPEPTGTGKRRAVEASPTLPPPDLTFITTTASDLSSSPPDLAVSSIRAAPSTGPNRRRDSRRSTPYDKPA